MASCRPPPSNLFFPHPSGRSWFPPAGAAQHRAVHIHVRIPQDTHGLVWLACPERGDQRSEKQNLIHARTHSAEIVRCKIVSSFAPASSGSPSTQGIVIIACCIYNQFHSSHTRLSLTHTCHGLFHTLFHRSSTSFIMITFSHPHVMIPTSRSNFAHLILANLIHALSDPHSFLF